tara:strand:+ start:694 stop:960 length:267 start_codon:yes stop_codon:yes gene_type:complete
MSYKIRRYRNFKRRNFLDTYEPKKRIDFSKEEALPWMIRIGHKFAALGGFMGFWASSVLLGLKGMFGFKKKIDRFSFNNKVVEIRVKK